jgi:beta-glucanase (GH16 family)
MSTVRHVAAKRRVRFAVAAAALAAVGAVGGLALTGITTRPSTVSVVNGDFSAGTTGWQTGKNARLAATPDGRNNSEGVRMTNDSGAATTVTLNDSVNSGSALVAGHTYEATAWVQVEGAGQGVLLRLLEEDASFHVIDSEQSFQWRADTAWTPITTRYTATRTGTTLDVHVSSRLAPGEGVVVDDVTLVDTSSVASGRAPAADSTPAPGRSPARTPAPEPGPEADGWHLAWADEFNGTSIDRNAWNVENNSTYGDGNEELSCLMDRPENVKVSEGVLSIMAREEATPYPCSDNDRRFPDGRSYTSGMLTTKNKVDFEYGRFEIRARTPLTQGTSKGLWPAFWLRPSSGSNGEIDILEAVGTGKDDPFKANRIKQTIHYDYAGTRPKQSTGYDLPSGTTAGGFHSYAVEWEPGSITWFVDGVKTYERNSSTTSWLDETFVDKFYMRLNLAVGGSWPGSPTEDTVFPAAFHVDYVRVYQRELESVHHPTSD